MFKGQLRERQEVVKGENVNKKREEKEGTRENMRIKEMERQRD